LVLKIKYLIHRPFFMPKLVLSFVCNYMKCCFVSWLLLCVAMFKPINQRPLTACWYVIRFVMQEMPCILLNYPILSVIHYFLWNWTDVIVEDPHINYLYLITMSSNNFLHSPVLYPSRNYNQYNNRIRINGSQDSYLKIWALQ